MDSKDVLQIFKETGAMLEGHFILTSGLHSPHYFQCAKVLQYPKYNTCFSSEVIKRFPDLKPDVVISPAVGGIVFGTEVGRQLGCRTIFAERENGEMTLRRGFNISKGENVFVVEDVITTGGSVIEVIELVRQLGARPVGVGVIIDRSNSRINFGCDYQSLAKVEIIKFHENEIPAWLKAIPVSKPGSRRLKN
ncbi:MAG: orotate phosphoribosyltransferase [Ignavibacteriaceae bacterium]|jgi:orotate phosphoribosyltransferase, Thermus family|nr:MAG: orotate phosphoribosyltransferase [Chlorobiota bacterium]KXK04570.1 MAG: orotate phosphoribosyltransferase [Chlorobi bacterium OLB4]MBV6399392.1 Orotate phosphoribosyltransferase [Ignavibacteria bacterium]MCC6886855.1 orotate phosphoribosyltransferase [Ignavibacteriales bacterium]MCE7953910.1 orotate phosphoribosyltransferase [Chlorobi bacterium CHB7]MDL1887843.1 orotate phosphoribosyltransferase [Ignavibacteria bacterium CHB1]MEB2330526.1 orotate phosphoribosyltransferase [Ignavibact